MSAAKKTRRGSSGGGGGGVTGIPIEHAIAVLIAEKTNMCRVLVTLKKTGDNLAGSSISAHETPNKDQGDAFMVLALHASNEIEPTKNWLLDQPAVFKCIINRESKEKFDICFHTLSTALSERKVIISIGEDGAAIIKKQEKK
jgi:hypothetical protein